jgi:hypothetical protein
MKFKFYNQYKNITVENLPVSTEIYDLDFHVHLVEDAIRYAFNILTNPDMIVSELHEFYFKMLYFYDRLELILFANILEGNTLFTHYKDYTTKANLKFTVYDGKKEKITEDHEYNAFLMSSIIKSSETNRVFNINRLNDFLGKRSQWQNIKKYPKIEDMDIAKQIAKHKRTNKVYSNMLPIGHFLNTSMESSTIVAIPRIYLPEKDTGLESQDLWQKIYDFSRPEYGTVENNIIIGYHEKNPSGIDIRFKLRPPVQKIVRHEDSRMIERGSACSTRKKEDLQMIVDLLGIAIDMTKNLSIKSLCNEVKLELMHREMAERRKVKHMTAETRKAYKQIKWYYLHYEHQPDN